MAVKKISNTRTYTGLATDSKPSAPAGSFFFETDTLTPFRSDGTNWVAKVDSLAQSPALEEALGNIPGVSVVHKFGGINAIASATVFSPMCIGAVYQTPQPAGAVALRVKAGNAADDAAGAGAREVTITGLDALGAFQEVAIVTAGASASALTSETWIRMYSFKVTKSGGYASLVAGSHTGDIVIEESGGTVWGTVEATNIGRGRSQIGAYSVPLANTAFLRNFVLTTGSIKPVDFMLVARPGILEAAAPYSAMELESEFHGIEGEFISNPELFYGPIPALTDVAFLARGPNTPDASVDFEIILIAD